MKHFYTEIENITLVFDDIKTNQDGMDSISLHFEKPIEDGFAFLDTSLPTLYVERAYGFSEMEIYHLIQYARTNASLIWKLVLSYAKGEENDAANYKTRLCHCQVV